VASSTFGDTRKPRVNGANGPIGRVTPDLVSTTRARGYCIDDSGDRLGSIYSGEPRLIRASGVDLLYETPP
jgi:hypothetical protein